MKTPPKKEKIHFASVLLGAILLAAGPLPGIAEEAEVPPAGKESDAGSGQIHEAPEVVTTRHSIMLNGETIAYTARTGKLALKDREGETTAEIFFIAYTRDATDPSERPITFSFNGGPGSSSVWMHMGLLGPRRVLLDKDGFALPPPHQLAENPWSLLDVSDLVFIDPVSTGFSRPADFEKEKEFHGLEEDVGSVGDFIRRYVTEFERWSSPKFLIGESYGTTRAAALSLHLQDRYGMYLNGIMLVSSVLDFSSIRYSEDNDLPYVLFLPSMAATARYHDRLSGAFQKRPLRDFLDEVKAFAAGPYREALFQGDNLPGEAMRSVAGSLSAYTGIAADDFLEYRLRLDAFSFFEMLLKKEGKRIGRFDGRYTGIAPLPWESWETGKNYDPSYSQIYGAYSSAFNDYVRRTLEYESDLPYEILANVRPWNFGEEFTGRYVNVSQRLREALIMNPHLRIQVCAGYYDLATPCFAAEYTFNRMLLHPQLRGNITFTYYEAGHMMYTVEKELARQKEALAAFIKSAVPEK
ncbi:MAG: S10 family peptidase [Oceanipulchritudo sp.]